MHFQYRGGTLHESRFDPPSPSSSTTPPEKGDCADDTDRRKKTRDVQSAPDTPVMIAFQWSGDLYSRTEPFVHTFKYFVATHTTILRDVALWSDAQKEIEEDTTQTQSLCSSAHIDFKRRESAPHLALQTTARNESLWVTTAHKGGGILYSHIRPCTLVRKSHSVRRESIT